MFPKTPLHCHQSSMQECHNEPRREQQRPDGVSGLLVPNTYIKLGAVLTTSTNAVQRRFMARRVAPSDPQAMRNPYNLRHATSRTTPARVKKGLDRTQAHPVNQGSSSSGPVRNPGIQSAVGFPSLFSMSSLPHAVFICSLSA